MELRLTKEELETAVRLYILGKTGLRLEDRELTMSFNEFLTHAVTVEVGGFKIKERFVGGIDAPNVPMGAIKKDSKRDPF